MEQSKSETQGAAGDGFLLRYPFCGGRIVKCTEIYLDMREQQTRETSEAANKVKEQAQKSNGNIGYKALQLSEAYRDEEILVKAKHIQYPKCGGSILRCIRNYLNLWGDRAALIVKTETVNQENQDLDIGVVREFPDCLLDESGAEIKK